MEGDGRDLEEQANQEDTGPREDESVVARLGGQRRLITLRFTEPANP